MTKRATLETRQALFNALRQSDYELHIYTCDDPDKFIAHLTNRKRGLDLFYECVVSDNAKQIEDVAAVDIRGHMAWTLADKEAALPDLPDALANWALLRIVELAR